MHSDNLKRMLDDIVKRTSNNKATIEDVNKHSEEKTKAITNLIAFTMLEIVNIAEKDVKWLSEMGAPRLDPSLVTQRVLSLLIVYINGLTETYIHASTATMDNFMNEVAEKRGPHD